MKYVFNRLIISIIFLIYSGTTHSQIAEKTNDTIWYNENWDETDYKSTAWFYRPKPKPDNGGYRVIDFYKNGQKQMEGIALNEDATTWTGKVFWFYPNQKPQIIRYFFEPNRVRKEEHFYPNGQLKYSSTYSNNRRDGTFISYHPNGTIAEKGQYTKGQKSGKWLFFDTERKEVSSINI